MSEQPESAWLVEFGDSPTDAPLYLVAIDWPRGEGTALARWGRDHNEAVRFSRRVDAERAMSGALEKVRICEHGWG
jgi:hypothetical protein